MWFMGYLYAVEQNDTVRGTTPGLYLSMLTQNKSLVPDLHQVTFYTHSIRMHNIAPRRLHFE